MIELLASYGAARGVHLLAYYGDLATAAAVFAANPALADDIEAFENAAEQGHEAFIRLMLRDQPDLPRRTAIGAKTPELNELLFAHGMNPSGPDWLGVTPLHHFARRGDVRSGDPLHRSRSRSECSRRRYLFDSAGLGGQIRQGRHGRAAVESRCTAERGRRSAVGNTAGMGDTPGARSDRAVAQAEWCDVVFSMRGASDERS